jgi:predicted nucleic acid-binding protein
MIAAICAWHEHHEQAANEIQHRLDRREKMVVAAPALVETYAVLTRLPPPHRLSPEDTLALLEGNFLKSASVVALDMKSYQALLRQAPKHRVSGGQTYDAVIAGCAKKPKPLPC